MSPVSKKFNLAYVRNYPGRGPQLCLQRTKNDELEVYELTLGQASNIMQQLANYVWMSVRSEFEEK